MLTDTQLKNIKAIGKLFKVADRDGLYIAVTKTGHISFRYDYRLNGRRETIVLGKYGPDGIASHKIRCNGDHVKPARDLKVGDELEITIGQSDGIRCHRPRHGGTTEASSRGPLALPGDTGK